MLHSRVQQISTNLHYLGYTDYDGYGNLAQQTNHVLTSLGGATEDYTYDKLHCLTQSSITLSGATSNIDYAYDISQMPSHDYTSKLWVWAVS